MSLARPLRDFLAETDWAEAEATPIAGDASARRYYRLTQRDKTAILMDARPESAAHTTAFVQIATHLRGLGLSPPRIYQAAARLLLLEDLGDAQFTHLLDETQQIRLYSSAIDVLLTLTAAPAPACQPYGPTQMTQALAPFFDYVAPNADRPVIEAAMTETLRATALAPPVLALRDYHAGNLIWLPDRQGPARVGLLDFQDAVLADPAYDLASLLDDVRLHVAPDHADHLIARFGDASGHGSEPLLASFAAQSVQRNLRILGIFARLAEAGRSGYQRFVPRTVELIRLRLAHPALAPLAKPLREVGI